MNVTEFKEALITEFRKKRIYMPKRGELQTEALNAFILQSVDKTILWFVENYNVK